MEIDEATRLMTIKRVNDSASNSQVWSSNDVMNEPKRTLSGSFIDYKKVGVEGAGGALRAS